MLSRLIKAIRTSLEERKVRNYLTRGIESQNDGNLKGAIECFRAALALSPRHADALCLLGDAYRFSGDVDRAVVTLRSAVAASPQSPTGYLLLAAALPLPKCRDELIGTILQAATLSEDSPDLRLNYRLGQQLRDAGDYERAIGHFARALEVHGDDPRLDINAQLANLLHATGQVERARRHYAQAWEVNHSDAMRLRRVTLIPPIPQSRGHIAQIRSQLVQEAETLLAQDLHPGEPEQDIGHTEFYLAYHGLDDRRIKELLARLYLHAYPALGFVSSHLAGVVGRSDRKLRIGIVSAYLKEHTIGRLMLGFFRHFRRDVIDVTAFVFAKAGDDIAREIHALCNRVVILDDGLHEARAQVAEEQVDLLLYCDIGMEPFTYFLAFARLAPVQCVTWGHPVTTGLPEIDYFLSSALVEPADGADHYTEDLVCLPEEHAFACYPGPLLPEGSFRDAQFDLPSGAHPYFCPQSLFKLHPDFDRIVDEILRADPAGWLCLIEHPPRLRAQIMDRWSRSVPGILPRVRFLPFCAREAFLQLLARANVILDTPCFGGGNSSFEAIAIGTPVVTLPGAHARSRFTYANYRRIGVMDCVARDEREYVDIAVRLGTDPAYRAAVRKRIVEANPRLYDDVGTVRAQEAFFIEAVGHVRSVGTAGARLGNTRLSTRKAGANHSSTDG